jgi:hypothetical protein
MGFAAGGSIGYGDISVFENGQLSAKLTGQNPVEDGALLVCDGKCMLKSEGISIIAADKSQVAVTNEEDTFKLYVKEGNVDYVISSNARKIAFYTPQGTYTVAEVVFNASSSPVVKGAVTVGANGHTEISVTEGKMVFATADGMKTVDANNKIVLADALIPPTDPAGGGITAGMVTFGVSSAAVIAGVIVAANDDGSNTSQSVGTSTSSTSSPRPTVVRPPAPTASPSN